MLDDKQIDRIIAVTVATLKPYYVQGEIQKWGKGNYGLMKRADKTPWPEFWPGYNQAVKERRELSVHIESGVFPDHLIHARSPNQTDKEFEYIKENFKQTTLPNWVDFENTIRRALHQSNWRMEFDDPEGDLAAYALNEVGEFGSFIDWMKFIVPKIKTMDPMGVLCVMPKHIPMVEGTADDGAAIMVFDPDELVRPEPIYFKCNDVWGYEAGKWYLLLTEEKSKVEKGGKEVMQGMVLWLVDDTNCWRIAQTGRAYELNFEVSLYFAHDQGYPPCMHLMGTPLITDGGRILWQSHYLPAKDLFDLVLLDATNLMLAKSNSCYPYRVMIGGECEYIEQSSGHRCVGGDLWGSDDKGVQKSYGKCNSCGGTGIIARLGPNGVLFVKERGMRDDGTQTKAADAMSFIEPGSHTLTILRNEITENTSEGRKMLHLHSEQPIAGGDAETATQVGVGVKAQMAFIAPIADQYFLLTEFVLDSIARQRYGFDEPPFTIIPATQFDLRTEADYMADLQAAQEAGLPPSDIMNIIRGYRHTRYGSDPATLEAFDVIDIADRLITVGWQQLAAMQGKGEVKAWEVALHNAAMPLYERLMQTPGFATLDVFEKAERLKALAEELYGQTVNPAAAPPALRPANPAAQLAARLVQQTEEERPAEEAA